MNDAHIRLAGPWTLHAPLGHGGNATVWRATRSGADNPIALKLISANKVHRERCQRFVREIGFLRDNQAPGAYCRSWSPTCRTPAGWHA
jgi:serine/threonine protein kinase